MPWSKSTQAIPELDSIEECARVMKEEFVVLFKHSPTCPVSWMANREVMQYRLAHPETPIYLVSVRRRRDVSRFIEEQTGIQHESPQIIVLRRGEVTASTSHDDITADTLWGFVEKSSGAASEVDAQGPVPTPGS